MSTWRFRPFPASAIAFGDGGVQKGGRVNRTLHVSKGRNFQRWKKERCKFPPAIRIVIPSSPPFISFIFLPLESENFLQKDAESFHLLEPVYTKNRGFRGFGESLMTNRYFSLSSEQRKRIHLSRLSRNEKPNEFRRASRSIYTRVLNFYINLTEAK